ncbi:MAG: SDR family NAD(P)-dependent oxidoreductase, partial [Actinomycetales bacterium]|nr:SDR family NAD(P)-dependent oxidoreductase [Leifsonia sp.]
MSVLTGTIAVVTGGRVGLGRALAIEVARRGATVIIASQSDAADTVTEIEGFGGTAEWVRTDVSLYADLDSLAHHVRAT